MFFFCCFQTKEDFEVRRQLVVALLEEHGQPLVQALLNACVYCLPSYMMVDVSEVIFEIMQVDRPVSSHYLNSPFVLCSYNGSANPSFQQTGFKKFCSPNVLSYQMGKLEFQKIQDTSKIDIKTTFKVLLLHWISFEIDWTRFCLFMSFTSYLSLD